ncbi:MAG: NifB/NifX family molybdenum-iron cluster-binding protein [Flavobacteriales bacterium]|nr:NifB/NifX family molybdenum-iron cluster-binding protein [Flavobacteriales bacterium]
MKIAVPANGNKVEQHFGKCDNYAIVEITDNSKIESIVDYNASGLCGCKSNIAEIFVKMGVETMLAGNMGQGAVDSVSKQGIKVVRGCKGEINDVVKGYLNDLIVDSGESCFSFDLHHAEGSEHQCGH